MKKFLVSLVALLFCVSCASISLAVNPADITSLDRLCGVPFFKAVYDGGPRLMFASLPTGKNSEASVDSWQNEEGDAKTTKFRFVARLLPKLDASFAVLDSGGDEGMAQFIVFDIRPFKSFGAGAIVPLQKGEELQLGARVNLGYVPRIKDAIVLKELTVYFAGQEGIKTRLGISYIPKFIRVDASLERNIPDQIWEKQLRISRGFDFNFGCLIPEIRLKKTGEDRFVGGGLGFVPKWD